MRRASILLNNLNSLLYRSHGDITVAGGGSVSSTIVVMGPVLLL